YGTGARDCVRTGELWAGAPAAFDALSNRLASPAAPPTTKEPKRSHAIVETRRTLFRPVSELGFTMAYKRAGC
ncbi:MAG TPA: hypothetical protein VFZ53_11295, partial [Polyangiaceae bacterium]